MASFTGATPITEPPRGEVADYAPIMPGGDAPDPHRFLNVEGEPYPIG